MGYWSAFWRGVKMSPGLPVEPIDYSPEAQLVRLVKRLGELGYRVPPDDCTCEFDAYEYDDPAEDDGEESWHHKRTCEACGGVWWSLHCPHDGIQNPCPACGWRPIGSRTPLQVLLTSGEPVKLDSPPD